MNLLIVEDEPILLEKYREYLSLIYTNIAIAKNKEEADIEINQKDFDVALVDYNLPDGFGLDLLKNFPNDTDSPVWVMITAFSKEKLAIESLNLGVYKYLEKPVDKNILIETMKASCEEAQKRESYNLLVNKFTTSKKTKTTLIESYFFSKREIEILDSILLNGKNKIVAKDLFISQGTVRNHLSNIFQKLHVHTKDELQSKIETMNKNLK